MRPREQRSARALPPLSREDRAFIKRCGEAGDPPKLIAAFTGRPEPEIRQVLSRMEGERRHG